jgi:hypothetical protein
MNTQLLLSTPGSTIASGIALIVVCAVLLSLLARNIANNKLRDEFYELSLKLVGLKDKLRNVLDKYFGGSPGMLGVEYLSLQRIFQIIVLEEYQGSTPSDEVDALQRFLRELPSENSWRGKSSLLPRRKPLSSRLEKLRSHYQEWLQLARKIMKIVSEQEVEV